VARDTVEIAMDRSADEVWAAIRDFGDLWWYEGVATCRSEGTERFVTTDQGHTLVERLLDLDDARRCVSYAVIDLQGAPPIELPDGRRIDPSDMAGRHEATITVVPEGPTACRVVYDLSMDTDELLLQSVRRRYGVVLEHLKAQL
jgi:hypothetical protein